MDDWLMEAKEELPTALLISTHEKLGPETQRQRMCQIVKYAVLVWGNRKFQEFC
jgi:GTPase